MHSQGQKQGLCFAQSRGRRQDRETVPTAVGGFRDRSGTTGEKMGGATQPIKLTINKRIVRQRVPAAAWRGNFLVGTNFLVPNFWLFNCTVFKFHKDNTI